jgi:hypothetical protein
MSLHPDHLKDLQKSGLTEDTITKANIHSVPPCDISKILGKTYADQVDSLLAFPYSKNGFCRYKLFPSIKDREGHKIKYFQPSGSGVHLYYPPGIEDSIADPSIPISFVEGEKKSLKGHQEGIVAIGTGGIWNFKDKGSNGLVADFDDIPLQGRPINLIPDGDYNKNKDVQKAVLSFAERLKEKGSTPYLISLPDGEEKIGLDDFLVQYGVSEFWDLPREEIKTDPFERLNLPTSLEISLLEIRVEWVVDGLIPKRAITMFHSVGGVGKSYFMYQLAKAVADRERFFGLDVIKMPVYYIDQENPLTEINDRTKRMGGSKNLWIWHVGYDPAPVRLDTEDWGIYKYFPPGLIIFDSLRSSHLLDENSSRDAALIMGRYKEIRELDNTIILIHHESKKGGYRGSTAWYDLSDHILKFSRVRKIGSDEDVDDDDFDLPIRLGLDGKSRASAAIDLKPMYFKFENHLLVSAEDPDREPLKDIYEELITRDKAGSPPFTQTDFISFIMKELKVGRNKAIKLINKGKGKFWSLLEVKGEHNKTLYTPIFYEK